MPYLVISAIRHISHGPYFASFALPVNPTFKCSRGYNWEFKKHLSCGPRQEAIFRMSLTILPLLLVLCIFRASLLIGCQSVPVPQNQNAHTTKQISHIAHACKHIAINMSISSVQRFSIVVAEPLFSGGFSPVAWATYTWMYAKLNNSIIYLGGEKAANVT